MASQAVNYRSFMNALGNRIGVDSQYLHKFIYSSSNSDYSRLLSVKEAITICENFLSKMDISRSNITTPTNRNSLNPLSVNTAKQILDKYISCFTWTVAFDTNDIGLLNTGVTYKTIVKDPVERTTTFSVTATGGGAGGGGAATLSGNKNSNYSIVYYQGYAGSASTLYVNETAVVSGAGGASLGSTTYSNIGKNPSSYTDGKRGSDGSSSTANVTIGDGWYVRGVKGAGGDGSGGIAISSSSTSTYTNSRNGVADNNWTGERTTAAGGGGSGGNSPNSPGSSDMRGINWSNVVATKGEQHQAIGTISKGGKGGYNSNSSTGGILPGEPEDIAGRSGRVGGYKFTAEKNSNSNGGNGGNSGTITGTSSVNIIYLLVS